MDYRYRLMMERTDCPSFQSQIAMVPTADLDSAACNSRKLLQDLATFKKNFPTMQHVFSTGNGPLKDHLQVPSSSAAAEAMLTEPPLLSDADHSTAITAARAQLKDKEKAVDLIQQILQNQNILIDGGVIQRTALKPTMDGLKTAEAALAEATKRPISYEVDLLQTPIKRGEEPKLMAVRMTSMYGQEYSCALPVVEEEEASEKIPADEQITDVQELLRPMKTSSCLLKGKDWWTYEFCFGHYIKQYHVEDGQVIGQIITLGLYDSDYEWGNETDEEKFKHVKQRYHSQYYVNGTKCDLTGTPRTAEVRLYCEEDSGDYISRVDEPGTCSYIITIHTSRLCSHPQLKPLPKKKAYSIPCSPLLNEEQYSKYLQKLKEEKEIAEQKRTQWLQDQQERLEMLKSGNLPNTDSQDESKESTKEDEKIDDLVIDKDSDEVDSSSKPTRENLPEYSKEAEAYLFEQYDKEIEKLKAIYPPEKFAAVRNTIQKQFDEILNEAEEDLNSELSKEAKDLSFEKLTSTLSKLLKKLDKAEKDVVEATKELNKVKSVFTESSAEDGDASSKEDKKEKNEKGDNSIVNEGPLEFEEVDKKQATASEYHDFHVHLRGAKDEAKEDKEIDANSLQRRKLEQAVKEKLEKAGLEIGGRKIEVKIISAGYLDNEEGREFPTLSDEQSHQFQNMIMALLMGQQEAVREMERHKKLEENYRYTWDDDENDNVNDKDKDKEKTDDN
ncbi:hypothetical protein CDAR_120661 [Caerostris darwini]|uniref:MRH domain-containing protein n=1 Tax=Caerostris darwini TaxID=1538125 RepID=A0AAV4SL86_9ARAC|nr:hypothetical protein CDAR_120661 [Caerostris darwini]